MAGRTRFELAPHHQATRQLEEAWIKDNRYPNHGSSNQTPFGCADCKMCAGVGHRTILARGPGWSPLHPPGKRCSPASGRTARRADRPADRVAAGASMERQKSGTPHRRAWPSWNPGRPPAASDAHAALCHLRPEGRTALYSGGPRGATSTESGFRPMRVTIAGGSSGVTGAVTGLLVRARDARRHPGHPAYTAAGDVAQ